MKKINENINNSKNTSTVSRLLKNSDTERSWPKITPKQFSKEASTEVRLILLCHPRELLLTYIATLPVLPALPFFFFFF